MSSSSDEFYEILKQVSVECHLCATAKHLGRFPKYSCNCKTSPPACKDCVQIWISSLLKPKDPFQYREEELVLSMKTKKCLICQSPHKNYEEYIQDSFSNRFEIKRKQSRASWVLVCLSLIFMASEILFSLEEAGIAVGQVTGLLSLDHFPLLRSYFWILSLAAIIVISLGLSMVVARRKEIDSARRVLWVERAGALNIILPVLSLLTAALMVTVSDAKAAVSLLWVSVSFLFYSLNVTWLINTYIILCIVPVFFKIPNIYGLDDLVSYIKVKYIEISVFASFFSKHKETMRQAQYIFRSAAGMFAISLLCLSYESETGTYLFLTFIEWLILLCTLEPIINYFVIYAGFQKLDAIERPSIVYSTLVSTSSVLIVVFNTNVSTLLFGSSNVHNNVSYIALSNIVKNLLISISLIWVLNHLLKKHLKHQRNPQKEDEELEGALQRYLSLPENGLSEPDDLEDIQEYQ